MAVCTLDDIEKILEDDKENDYSKTDSTGAQEKGSSNLVDPGSNFDNILQVFQNPQVIGFLRGMMTLKSHKMYNLPSLATQLHLMG